MPGSTRSSKPCPRPARSATIQGRVAITPSSPTRNQNTPRGHSTLGKPRYADLDRRRGGGENLVAPSSNIYIDAWPAGPRGIETKSLEFSFFGGGLLSLLTSLVYLPLCRLCLSIAVHTNRTGRLTYPVLNPLTILGCSLFFSFSAYAVPLGGAPHEEPPRNPGGFRDKAG
ncbi:hypothetical protein BGX38DRAFT_1220354 [Terfezia claveryi]|nr:hypothetical protein BGX38DRAFT_1220354 [Terfezia claveryi]